MKTDFLLDSPSLERREAADRREEPPLEPQARRQGFTSRLLAMPLYYKVLIANSAIVVLGALAGTTITLRVARAYPDARLYLPLCLLFTGAGLLLSVVFNGLLLKAAFQPLKSLRATARQVQQGNFSVRASLTSLADADMHELAGTLNSVLDDVEDYRAQMQALAGRVIRAQEEERRRIARELHDDTGQTLTLLLVRLKLLENSATSQERQAEIEELRLLVSAAIDRVRRMALDLRPPALDHLGLAASLRSLVRQLKETTHLAISLELPEGAITLSPERAIAVYRIVQEALTNILKHGNATKVQVKLARQDGRLSICVEDDGRGFDLRALEHTRRPETDGRGLGLFGMEERAHLLGGRFQIESQPGHGTRVQVMVPLEEAGEQAANFAG
jgi:two-component system sensor histidine kinase UhpB